MITEGMTYREWLKANDLVDTELNMVRYQNAIDCVTMVNGYTVNELRKAFDMVANPDDWKDVIDAWIEPEDWGMVATAIEFMTASEPWIAEQKDDKESGVTILRIQGRGYRNGPAGP